MLKSLVASALLWCFLGLGSALAADNQILAEVRFSGATSVERNAGVWVDGQYVGYLDELKGDKQILLLPGKHEFAVRQAGYKDFTEESVLEPGQVVLMKIRLIKDTSLPMPTQTAELKISVKPGRAAVFIDNRFIGHADEFSGLGHGLLVTPDKHRVRIALPGYQTFETEVTVRPNQKLKIETELVKGSITQAGPMISQK
ncbi:MAG TPA: PEGA domain-containing protein [Candidatus Sulfotelmatobacter sp.]|nr:PEGA domain-containing protein [Candidatus Sulfotelmatobacter sp.]